MCIDSKESASICHLKRIMFAAFRESGPRTEAYATRVFCQKSMKTEREKKESREEAGDICRVSLRFGHLVSNMPEPKSMRPSPCSGSRQGHSFFKHTRTEARIMTRSSLNDLRLRPDAQWMSYLPCSRFSPLLAVSVLGPTGCATSLTHQQSALKAPFLTLLLLRGRDISAPLPAKSVNIERACETLHP